MTAYYPLQSDLGQHAWHEEGGFFHGYLNGVYYQKVCTHEELEEVRQIESRGREKPLDNDEVWQILDLHNYVNPWDEFYGEFESASLFEGVLDFDARRKIIAVNMYLDPDTTTWYSLGNQYYELMSLSRWNREKVLKYRMLALGLDPIHERHPLVRSLRALALMFGLNPYEATWEQIGSMSLELHKIAIPHPLLWRAKQYLGNNEMGLDDLILKSLAYYLDCHENEAENEADKDQPTFNVKQCKKAKK